MNKVLSILASIIICQITFGQSKTDKITSKIIEEGKMLYKSEMASWYGTDIFIEKYKEKRKLVDIYHIQKTKFQDVFSTQKVKSQR